MMNAEYMTELLRMIWPYQAGRSFACDDGARVEIVNPGEPQPQGSSFKGAEIVADGVVCRGEVLLGAADMAAEGVCNAILQVTATAGEARVPAQNGGWLPQVVMRPGPVTQTAYDMLREGAGAQECARHIIRMDSFHRVEMYTRLLAERLDRKCAEMMEAHAECEQNWNETMYVQLFTWMGDRENKTPFRELARRVRYMFIARERGSLEYLEALLLGTSGLLDLYDDDRYTRTLKTHYEYLRQKYSITAMAPAEWSLGGNNPNNHPVIRLAQLAGFLATREFLFDNLLECRSVEDVHTLFRAEASEYWSTHYTPSRQSDFRRKKVGHFKANMLGINLVVPMMFSYASYMGDQTLKERALDLLEKIACEQGIRRIDEWRAKGVPMQSAFDSQALLELSTRFCEKGRCAQCPLGRRVVREVYLQERTNIPG